MDDADAYWVMFAATEHWDCDGWTTDSRSDEVTCACGVILGHVSEVMS